MRNLWTILLLAVPALAGCFADGPTEPTPDPTTLAPGVSIQSLGNAASDALSALHTSEGTYYSIGTTTFEPTIGATSTGGLFVPSLKRGLLQGEPDNGVHIIRSMDKGQTWEDIGPFVPGTQYSMVPNSNDPYIHVDTLTDRIYNFDMCLTLSGFCVSWSDDDGASWITQSVATGESPALDHQSMATAPPTNTPTTGYPNVLAFCVNRGPQAAGPWCSSSFDGGIGWTPLVPGYPVGTPQCSGLHGHLWGSSDGRFYRGNPACAGPAVYRSDDSGLTWTEHVITTDVGVLGHEIAVAADGGGGVYAFWVGDDGLPYLAVSGDDAQTWGEPFMVAADGVTAAGFPTIAAAAPGHVAFAYIGTDVEDGYDGDADDMGWTGYIGVVVDAAPAGLTVASVPVNAEDDPLDEERACGRIRCGGFGDFIDITIDAEGRPWAAMAHNDHGSAGIAGTLMTGPSLWGNGTLAPLPAGGQSVWHE